MNVLFPAVAALFVASAWAQTNSWFYQPLGQVKDFLQLSDSQLQALLANNDEYNEFSLAKQERIWQLQGEIITETARENLDPMALGVRYAEIETSCREMNRQAAAYRKKNTDILTEPQKTKLKVLEDAMKLAPTISEAQTGNLIASGYGLSFFTGNSGSTSVSGTGGPANGCYLPTPPFPGDMAPANRRSKTKQ